MTVIFSDFSVKMRSFWC